MNISRSLIYTGAGIALLGLAGCGSLNTFRSSIGFAQEDMEQRWTYGEHLGVDGFRLASKEMFLAKRTYAAVDALYSRAQLSIDKTKPLLVTSLVSVQALSETSPLGLMISEQVSGRSVQLGYRVHEIKLRSAISLKDQKGEFALSRELSAIKEAHEAQALVSGTYAVGDSMVHVNLKLTEVSTSRVLSSVDFVIPADRWQDRDIRSLAGER